MNTFYDSYYGQSHWYDGWGLILLIPLLIVFVFGFVYFLLWYSTVCDDRERRRLNRTGYNRFLQNNVHTTQSLFVRQSLERAMENKAQSWQTYLDKHKHEIQFQTAKA